VARQSQSSYRSAESETILAAGTSLRGRVRGAGSVTLAGHFEGDIHIEGALTIADSALVESPIQAEELTVLGELSGDIRVRGPVRLGSSANVRGDVKGTSFAMALGANFSGRLDADFDLPEALAGATSERKRR
jgi:cytoskeletal protein CcmA (bactofilin family)